MNDRDDSTIVAEHNSEKQPRRRLPLVVLLVVVGFGALLVGAVVGMAIGRGQGGKDAKAAAEEKPAERAEVWYCPMHAQQRAPEPGLCSICNMDLVLLEDDQSGPRELKMSAAAMALAEIETVPVRRQFVTRPVRMVGKVRYDETRLADITAWVGGRLDRLFVDYTGISVRKGDHLVSMYSPDLIVTQRELLQVWSAYNRATAGQDRKLLEDVLHNTEEKLRLLGLLDEQIQEIKDRGTPSDHLTIYSPVGGIVIEKHANEGAYVKTGTQIYTIADLGRVWVHMDAYESDIPWIRFGQEVEFTAESHPGEVFRGRVSFIAPLLDEKTRSVKVRVNVPNEDMRLKPGMFVRAVVQSKLADSGVIFDPSLKGKWISPMHPEVIKDGPGKCDVCGMDLVPIEQLGLVPENGQPQRPLVIPASAPLITGKRAVVYVRVPDKAEPTFEGREVVLGHRAADQYIVLGGLKEGEQVVVSGNFKIDADLQIKGKPSMMSEIPLHFRRRLDVLYEPYLKLQTALADDRLGDAKTHWKETRRALDVVRLDSLSPAVGDAWEVMRKRLAKPLEFDAGKADADALRMQFEQVAEEMIEVAKLFGHTRGEMLVEAYCPMAFKNTGAAWLQSGPTVDNPYFGHAMKRCGTVRRKFLPIADEAGDGEQKP